MSTRPPNRRGTTVLELVVALVITGAAAAAGTGAFRHLVDRRAQVLEVTRDTERATALRAMLHDWLDVATIETPPIADVPDDVVQFTTTAWTPVGNPGVVLRLAVDVDDNTPEHGLTLAARSRDGTAWTVHPLDASITTLQVEYLDAPTGRWVPARDVADAPPRAMRVRLLPTNAQTARLWTLPLTVPLPTPVGAEASP